jgi:hypothetical protein
MDERDDDTRASGRRRDQFVAICGSIVIDDNVVLIKAILAITPTQYASEFGGLFILETCRN